MPARVLPFPASETVASSTTLLERLGVRLGRCVFFAAVSAFVLGFWWLALVVMW